MSAQQVARTGSNDVVDADAALQSMEKTPSDHEDSEKHAASPSVRPRNALPPLAVLQKIAVFCAIAVIVFWILAAHIFGIFTNEEGQVRRASVAVVDFDGGAFGASLLNVTQQYNRTNGFPTFVIVDPNSTTPTSVTQQVFQGTFWAAFYAEAGSTDRFLAAVEGRASTYSPEDALVFVTSQGRYFQVFATSMLQNLEITSQSVAAHISQAVVRPLLQRRLPTNAITPAAVSALAFPVSVSQRSAGKHAFTMDDKPLINSVGTVLLTLMAIFPCIASHHIADAMRFSHSHSLLQHFSYRLFLSTVWPLFPALSSAGWIFAFRGSYPLDAKMFFAYWAVSWFYNMITFDIFDAFLCFAPMPITPLFAVTWVICSVTATLGPPDLLNYWYRVNYFFPALHWWQVVITILTQGGDNRLDWALPTLFGWAIVAKTAVFFGVRRQLRLAKKPA